MTFCPNCIRDDAVVNGVCRFCKKRADVNIPLGVLPPRTVLFDGRYMIGAPLGTGGFGIVYRARDTRSGKMVAIKEYAPLRYYCRRQLGGPEIQINADSWEDYQYGLKHFLAEINILLRLQSIPGVVHIFDSFQANHTAYYVMEYLEGQTLSKYVRSRGNRLAFSDAVKTLAPALMTLSQVHEHGVLHRDISPDNIFFCADGSIRLIDFGAAAQPDSRDVNSFTPVEKEGYSPPEQHTMSRSRGRQGTWSDVYAFAGTFYFCVMGKRPPPGSYRQEGDQLEFDSRLTESQIQVLRKGLELNPAKRYQSVQEFADALVKCLSNQEGRQMRSKNPTLFDNRDGKSRVWSVDVDDSHISSPAAAADYQSHTDAGRQIAAFAVDMLLFQLVPLAGSVLSEGAVLLWLSGGMILGILATWLMTISSLRGSPGEVLCGLRVVSDEGRRPDTPNAALYCLIRILWPLRLVDAICLLCGAKSTARMISGCHSVCEGGAAALSRQQVQIICTDGFFMGSSKQLVQGKTCMVGRDPAVCTQKDGSILYPLQTAGVSRKHLSLHVNGDNSMTVTNFSQFGTYVDGRYIGMQESATAHNGSVISFGNERMQVSIQ